MTSESIDEEISFYIRNVGRELGDNEKFKISCMCTKIINSNEYMNKVHEAFIPLANNEHFNLNTDLTELIKILINLNNKCDFYKTIEPDRNQYIYYAIIFASLIRNNVELMNKINRTDFRLIFSNAMELIMMPSQKLRLEKEDCINCVARTFKWLSWLENKLNIK